MQGDTGARQGTVHLRLLVGHDGPRRRMSRGRHVADGSAGSREVFRSQLEHLIEATQNVRITLQVTPFRSGGHAAEAGAFTIMRFPEEDLPDVVYLEQLTSALYLDKRDTVDHYMAVLERLCVEALPAEGSLKMIRDLLDD